MPGSDTYHVAARLLHWAMAVGFAFVWGCGYAMPRLVVEDGPGKTRSRASTSPSA